MINVKTNIRTEEVRQQAQHVLFVEGKQDSVDPKVLNEIFSGDIRIEPLGPSLSMRSVAEALYPHHPTYYFLIDRDHHKDDFVDRCWNNFPDADTHNLLVWHRREIENYFLDPKYLALSQYCEVEEKELGEKILSFANKRLFFDAANLVVISIREELKINWIEKFTNPADFSTNNDALRKLKGANEFKQHRTNVDNKLSTEEIEDRFYDVFHKMTGGQEGIAFGRGDWLELIQGKKVFAEVANSSCFKVVAANGTVLKGREKLNAIVEDLLRKGDAAQPQDFIKLKELISNRVKG